MDQMKIDRAATIDLEKHLIVYERAEKARANTLNSFVPIEIGKHVLFDPAVLDTFNVQGFTARHYDLMVLCAAIEFADRRWKRPAGWLRRLHLTVPVIDFDCWSKSEIQLALLSVMNFLTGDSWRFTFIRAKNASPVKWRQFHLWYDDAKTIAIAYSSGLDSRAVSALSGSTKDALCIRVAGNNQRPLEGDTYFTQIPFKVTGYVPRESSFRSRGFQFAALTAIAAHLSNITRIVVPESGQGALGPVLLPLYNIYPDYRNFPGFFRKMERFARALLAHSVKFEQPRLWSTKGETLTAFLTLPGKGPQDLVNTQSCWQTRRVVNAGHRRQCGLCAACLLRRMSLHAANILEPAETYVVSDLTCTEVNDALEPITNYADRNIMIEYGSVGARHLQHLADLADFSDTAIRPFASQIAAATGEPYEQTLRNLRMMLMTHAEEWRAFVSAQGDKTFLKSWMDGGRNDRLK